MFRPSRLCFVAYNASLPFYIYFHIRVMVCTVVWHYGSYRPINLFNLISMYSHYPVDSDMYSIQLYAIQFVSGLRHVGGFVFSRNSGLLHQ